MLHVRVFIYLFRAVGRLAPPPMLAWKLRPLQDGNRCVLFCAATGLS